MNEKTLKEFQRFQKAMDGGAVQPDELKEVIDFLIEIISQLKNTLEDKISQGDDIAVKQCQKMVLEMQSIENRIRDISKMVSKSEVENTVKLLRQEIKTLKESIPTIPTMPDLSVYDAKLMQLQASIPIIKDTILDTPEQIRDKLESIDIEDDKLSIDAIKNLPKKLEEIKKEAGNGQKLYGGLSRVGGDMAYTKYHGGASNLTVSTTAPSNPELNDLWYDIS